MKAFFTVTEDSSSRRMGIFKLTFTLHIMCKFINGKGEEKNCQQSFTIFSIDVTGNASVCVCLVFFKVVVIPMSTRTTILQAWQEFRVNLQLSLCR